MSSRWAAWIVGLGIFAGMAPGIHAANRVRLSYSSDFSFSTDPLTTEKAWSIDPDERNPHRRRWALKRELNLVGLDSVKLADGKFGVDASGIVSRVTGYVRGDGPWYQDPSRFPCSPRPVAGFATREGSRVAAEAAEKLWDKALSGEKEKLGYLLERISATSASLATARALNVFHAWRQLTEEDWRERMEKQARQAEWEHYAEVAQKTHGCVGKKKMNPSPQAEASLSWESMMEPVPAELPEKKLLARAPARRWDGIFSVRVSVKITDQTLVGRFLVDSSATQSILDPSWLENQGIPPAWIEIPGLAPRKVRWTGGEGLARTAIVDRAEVSGLALPQRQFLLLETLLFEPPREVGTCCDGVLGSELLNHFVVEFIPGPPAALNIWDRTGFALPASTPWFEVSQDRSGVPVSASCRLTSGKKSITGIQWNTAQVAPLEVVGASGRWDLTCGGTTIARGIEAKSVPRSSVRSAPASAGISLLARARFLFDLPHGRLWFPENAFAKKIPANRYGLKTAFVYRKSDRTLILKSIQPGSPAASLAKQGLKPGAEITRIDNKDVVDMDQWEVEQRLAGVYGETVGIEWMATPKSAKMAALNLAGK